MDSELIKELSIPLFTAVIGYVTNWSGVIMLFYPVHFHGVRMPGLAALSDLFPRRIQQIPGVMQGGIGWQGIIPSRAAKMGSIAVDKGIAKVGGASDFYQQLEPEKIAEQILATARSDIHDVVERIMVREHEQLWNDLPQSVRDAVHARVQDQLPEMVKTVTDEIGEHVDQLLDPKLMVIRHIEANPALANRIFLEVGRRELRFMVNFGFVCGLVLGIPLVFITQALPYWWVLPIGGVFIGYFTNWMGLWMIFEPVDAKKIGPFKIQGLFIRRQPQVAGVYAGIIADDIVTISNIGEELLEGRRSDRTRQMIETAMRPALDRAVGLARPVVRAAVGRRQYDAIRESVATESVDYALTPLTDPEFNRQQSAKMRKLFKTRIAELAPSDFSEMLRSAMREDEWLLLLHGAVLGFVAGLIHLAIFGV